MVRLNHETTVIRPLFLIVVLLATFVRPATACECYGPQTAEANLTAATYVFSGKVLRVMDVEDANPHDTMIVFRVTAVWKGEVLPTFPLYAVSQNTCHWKFEENRGYLVFARMERVPGPSGYQKPVADICLRTMSLADAQEFLAGMGQPKVTYGKVGE